MSILNIQKLNSLPAPELLEASTLYLIKSQDAGMLEVYLTGNTNSEVRHIIDKTEIINLITSELTTQASTTSVELLISRDIASSDNNKILINNDITDKTITILTGQVKDFGFAGVQNNSGKISLIADVGVELIGNTLSTLLVGDMITVLWLADNKYAVYVTSVN